MGDPLAVMVLVEARPAVRPGVALEHGLGGAVRLEEALTAGLGSVPDVELRTSLIWDRIAPVRPWVSYRIRRVDLPGLAPLEDYLAVGVGMASGERARMSLAGGLGIRFQLPPIAPEEAHNAGEYVTANISALMFFGLRVRLW